MNNKLSFLIAIALIIFSCNNNKEKVDVNHSKENELWTYQGETGPEHWSEIEKESQCDGKQQSPINIININAINDLTLKPVETQYSSSVKIHEVTNNGHSIQYNFEKGDYIIFDEKNFDLKQIHFHEPSEHTINGIRYPLEMHLVHVSKDNNIVVIAIMAEEGKSSEAFTFLEKYLPINTGETKQINTNFDLNLNLPKNRDYYKYNGSLTTPPCTENVTWLVYKNPIFVSFEQVIELQKLMPINNYRTTQPLNGRIVKQYVR